MNRSRTLRPLLAAAVVVLVSAACATQRVDPPAGEDMAGVAPVLSVERFLQASNARDYQAMARLFGTYDGPMAATGGDQREVEQRMAAIAEVLGHDDYRITSERGVPGHRHDANRIGVDITMGNRVVRDVAFVVVRSQEGAWLVESIDLQKVAGG